MYLQRRAKSPLISILIVSTFKVSPRTVTSTQNFLWTRNVSLGTGSKEKAPGGLGGIKSSRMRKPEVSTTIPDETILSKAGWLMRAPSYGRCSRAQARAFLPYAHLNLSHVPLPLLLQPSPRSCSSSTSRWCLHASKPLCYPEQRPPSASPCSTIPRRLCIYGQHGAAPAHTGTVGDASYLVSLTLDTKAEFAGCWAAMGPGMPHGLVAYARTNL